MKILSHRGFWYEEIEKNSLGAFRNSFKNSFGIETDLRDYNGDLVISHNIPNKDCEKVDSFFELYNSFDNKDSFSLALNIKSDGLQKILSEKLVKYDIKNYFVFDMSIPDTLGYIEKKINFFIRQSEIEKELPFYEKADGVWIDCFYNDWVTENLIQGHLKNNKKVCLVSPELHKRDHLEFWDSLRKMDLIFNDKVFICTDFPKDAKEYFYE